MKRPLLLSISALSVIALTTLQSYNDGPATNLAQATGAPGSSNNNCTTCHGGGGFGSVSVDFQLLTDSGNAVTEYVPGESYTINAAVNHSNGNPSGFGIQVVALDDANDATSGTWANPSANAKLVTLSSRNYFEQNAPSSANLFTCDWTAPAQGTGSVTFYMGANAVNGNGGNSGDNAVLDQVTFEEAEADSANGIFEIGMEQLSVFPNPATEFIQISSVESYNQTEIYAISGQKMSVDQTGNGMIDVSSYPTGIYILKTENKIARFVKR